MSLVIDPIYANEERYSLHPIGQDVVDLGFDYEEVALDRITEIQSDIATISDDLYVIVDLLKEMRKAKEQGGDHINLSHLEKKVHQFREIWDQCADRYQIIKADEDPFMGKNLSSIHKNDLEWVEMTMRNLESKHQGQIQTQMTQLETAMTAQKMIFEIFVQIAKSIRESQGYWTKKQTN